MQEKRMAMAQTKFLYQPLSFRAPAPPEAWAEVSASVTPLVLRRYDGKITPHPQAPPQRPAVMRKRRQRMPAFSGPTPTVCFATMLLCASPPLLALPRLAAAAGNLRDAELYTDSGYDTDSGRDAICWVAPRLGTEPQCAARANVFNVAERRRLRTRRENLWDSIRGTLMMTGRDHPRRQLRRGADVAPALHGGQKTKLPVTAQSRPLTPTADVFVSDSDDRASEAAEVVALNNSAVSPPGQDHAAVLWPSELVPAFPAGRTHMLSSCPRGVDIRVDAPDEIEAGETMRVGSPYTYRIRGEIRLDLLRDELGLTDRAFFHSSVGGPAVAVKVKQCPMGGQFCSPFLFVDERRGEGWGEDILGDGKKQGEGHAEGPASALSAGHEDVREEGKACAENGTAEKDDDQHAVHDANTEEELLTDEHHHIESETRLLSFTDRNQMVFRFNVTKLVSVEEAGTYMPLAEMQFFLADKPEGSHTDEGFTDSDVLYKFDIANALHEQVITIHDPPKINVVSLGAEAFTYMVIGIAGLIQLLLMVSTIKHRKHSVAKLTQGYFLLIFLLSAFVATVCCFLFNPKNDVYCQLLGPLVMIPLQFMLAIVTGRLKRIIVVMSPLFMWQQEQCSRRGTWKDKAKLRRMMPSWVTKSLTSETSALDSSRASSHSKHSSGMRGGGETDESRMIQEQPRSSPIALCFSRCKRRATPKTLRAQFTVAQLWAYISYITLPQVVVQVIGIAIFPQKQIIIFNEGESVGRPQCASDRWPSYHFAQYVVLALALLHLVYVSHKSKSLPSLFDEAESVASGVFLTFLITAIGTTVIAASSEPTSPPDVRYIMLVAIVVCLTVNMSYRLILPKLRLVWNGEQVVVSQLVHDHKKRTRRASTTINNIHPRVTTPLTNAGSWLSTRILSAWKLNAGSSAKCEVRNVDEENGANKEEGMNTEDLECSQKNNIGYIHDGEEKMPERPVALQPGHQTMNSTHGDESCTELAESTNSNGNRVTWANNDVAMLHRDLRRKSLVISETRRTPEAVTVNVIMLAELVARVNRRILSGLQVPAEEWEELQQSLHDMNEMFTNQVKFSWKDQGVSNDENFGEE